jgi:hypothetical protein
MLEPLSGAGLGEQPGLWSERDWQWEKAAGANGFFFRENDFPSTITPYER